MKKAILLVSTAVLLALTAAGCEDEVESLSTDSSAVDRVRAGDLTFTLQILNMQGEPQEQFEEGENFQFQFTIENKSDGTYESPEYWYFPVADNDFFALYRKTQEGRGVADLGKSFKMGTNSRDASLALVPPNSSLVYTIPWVLNNSSYLMPKSTANDPRDKDRYYVAADDVRFPISSGDYFTGFTFRYNETDSVRLEASFVVK